MEDKEVFDGQFQAPWFVRGLRSNLQDKKVRLEIYDEKEKRQGHPRDR